VDQFQPDGAVRFSGANRRRCNYTVEADDGQDFKITAATSGHAKKGSPTLSIDENMEVKQQ
jgi:hypothetical protein